MNGTEVNPATAQNCAKCGARLPAGALAGLCPACLLQQGAAPDTRTGPAAHPFEPPPVAELAPLFPQLEILALLGKGGMGAVYKARQKQLDRWVALKILPPASGEDPAFAERFTREARALAQLNHPGIVTLYEFGCVQDRLYYFLMEFVDGVNLRQLLAAGRVSPREALGIVPQICDALQFAHDQGVVHRDIKPENILLDRRGRVKVADFGLAKLARGEPEPRAAGPPPAGPAALTGMGQVMGTPNYMAPEQLDTRQTLTIGPTSMPWASSFTRCSPASFPAAAFSPRPGRSAWTSALMPWSCAPWKESPNSATSKSAKSRPRSRPSAQLAGSGRAH